VNTFAETHVLAKLSARKKEPQPLIPLPNIGKGLERLEKKQRPITPWLLAAGGLATLGGGYLMARALRQGIKKIGPLSNKIMMKAEQKTEAMKNKIMSQTERKAKALLRTGELRAEDRAQRILSQAEISANRMADNIIGKARAEVASLKSQATSAIQGFQSKTLGQKLKTIFGGKK